MVYLVYWDLFGGCPCWDLWVLVYLKTTIFFSQKYGGFLQIPIQLKIGVTPPCVALATDLPRQGPSQLSSAATSLVGPHAGWGESPNLWTARTHQLPFDWMGNMIISDKPWDFGGPVFSDKPPWVQKSNFLAWKNNRNSGVDFWDSGGIGVLAAYKEGDRAWNSEIVWEHSRLNLFAWDGFVQTWYKQWPC